ncbi:MAG: methyltransferase [Clostridiales bacterium]|jgi:16S rRNA (guanine1207-N2)-methyltransferase|nr:methyltransferase [Clostridiales bacterium]
MGHYFENDEKLKPDKKEIGYSLDGYLFRFFTDSGVFSKDELDKFSLVFIDCLKKLPISGDVLDLGCGYGIIGIIISRHFPEVSLYQSDINKSAVELTKKNCLANNIDSAVILSDGFSEIDNCFDWIFLNPPIHAGKQVMFNLYSQALSHLNKNGKFLIVIHKKHGAQSTLNELKSICQSAASIYKKKGLYVFMCSNDKYDAEH